MSIKQATAPLPPLPDPDHSLDCGTQPFFTADQMREYALAALRSMPAEPVAYSVTRNGRHVGNLYDDIESATTRMKYLNQHLPEDNRAVVPLFATPHTAPVPLSDAEIYRLWGGDFGTPHRVTEFARAIERAVLGRGGALAGDTGAES